MSLEQWQQGAGAANIQTVSVAVVKLVDAAKEADAAYQLGQRLVVTSFCPVAFRGKPEEAAVAMMAGAEIGLSPLAALGAFDVISGRAAPRAVTLRAVALSRGHEIELVDSTDTRCRMRGRRRGAEQWQTVLWTIERATLAGFVAKNPNWKTQPAAMLVARATSEVARLIASDALLGLGGGYSAEEYADGTDQVQTVPAPSAPVAARRTLSYAPKPDAPQIATCDASQVEAAVDTEPVEAEVVDAEPVKPRTLSRRKPADPVEAAQTEIRDLHEQLDEVRDGRAFDQDGHRTDDRRPRKLSTEQRGKIMAMFTRLGIVNRAERLEYTSFVVGRPIESTSDLTAAEAHRLIDHLDQIPDAVAAADQIAGDQITTEVVDDE